MQPSDPVVIVSVARTPMGRYQGQLAGLSAAELGAAAIQAAVARSGMPAGRVSHVQMGCALPEASGWDPARQAGQRAGISLLARSNTIGKGSASGMAAAVLAHDALLGGSRALAVAGGMESMSSAPERVLVARGGYLRHSARATVGQQLRGGGDLPARLVAAAVERCAQALGFSREARAAYAAESRQRMRAAVAEAAFGWEIAPVRLPGEGGALLQADEWADGLHAPAHTADAEHADPSGPADGATWARDASHLADGAAALVLARRSIAERLGLAPLAIIAGHATHATTPSLFPLAPVGAIRRLLSKTGWGVRDVQAWEIGETFAVVPMAAMKQLSIDPEILNAHGGACALGHPMGASGARLIVTLLGCLCRTGRRRGVASQCMEGGGAMAVALEML